MYWSQDKADQVISTWKYRMLCFHVPNPSSAWPRFYWNAHSSLVTEQGPDILEVKDTIINVIVTQRFDFNSKSHRKERGSLL